MLLSTEGCQISEMQSFPICFPHLWGKKLHIFSILMFCMYNQKICLQGDCCAVYLHIYIGWQPLSLAQIAWIFLCSTLIHYGSFTMKLKLCFQSFIILAKNLPVFIFKNIFKEFRIQMLQTRFVATYNVCFCMFGITWGIKQKFKILDGNQDLLS